LCQRGVALAARESARRVLDGDQVEARAVRDEQLAERLHRRRLLAETRMPAPGHHERPR